MSRRYFLRLIRSPGSLVLVETRFPRPSRVVWNMSLVRPADFVVFIADDIRCAAAVAAGDRPDDSAIAVANEIFFEHLCFPPTK